LGLAHRIALTRDVAAGTILTWRDVAAPQAEAARVRREMESMFAAEWGLATPEPVVAT